MGQAALKYDDFDELDQVPIPEGGIATFLTAETGSWADDDDEVPPKGITNVVKIADKLAEYGRNEDEYMVHAAEGETVIPMEVFKQNPALKDKLFAEMRIMGIEPERYIVGNELNSINPITGQPEFFLKKLFRGLKKVVKKVLPVVAKVLLTPIVGPVAASAIVDGASAIIQGGSFKDGLKAAAIGGISSFAAGRIGDAQGWATSSAKQMATEAAINTTLSGGKPRDILTSAATAAATTKALDFASDKLAPAGAKSTATVDPAYAQQLAQANPAELARLQNLEGVTVPDLGSVTPQVTRTAVTDTAVADAASGQVTPTGGIGRADARTGVKGPATRTDVESFSFPGRGPPPATDPLAGLGDLGDLGYSDEVFGQSIDPATSARMKIGQTEVLKATDPNIFNRQQLKGALERLGVLTDTEIQSELDKTYPLKGTTTISTPAPGQKMTAQDLFAAEKVPGLRESFGNLIKGTGEGRMQAFRDIFLPSIDRTKVRTFLEQGGKKVTGQDITDFIKENTKELNYGFIRRFAPLAATTLGLSALTTEEIDPIDITDRTTGLDLIRANPETYRIFDDDRTYTPARFTIERAAGVDSLGTPAFRPTPINTPPFGFEEGGEIMNFPRMNGPIEGPGTETSDDIPAMLSDGEFVFTAKAVRGAGKGSREDGMRNMYKMMRQFEARV